VSPDAFAGAAGCRIMSHARELAAWVGEGKPVTAKGVLRPSDVHQVAKALGVTAPAHVRTAADVEAIHRPWVFAQAVGMMTVGEKHAVAQAYNAPASQDVWFSGFEAVLRAESYDRHERGAAIACRLVLTALAADPPPAAADLEDVVHQLLEAGDFQDSAAVYQAFRRGLMPVEAALGLLRDFGTVDEPNVITPSGRWVLGQLRERIPGSVSADLPADTFLTRLAALSDADAWEQAQGWLHGRRIGDTAGLLLAAAAGASARERTAAVNIVSLLGEAALPAWRNALRFPALQAHARAQLAAWGEGLEPSKSDRRWLVTEYALAAVAAGDLDDAWHSVHDLGGFTAVEDSGHPGTAELIQALRQFAASGGGQVRIHQLKIALSRMRPPVWRRVLMPDHATLGDLNRVIKVVLDWGEDHLHTFAVGGADYSDPFFELPEHGDEERIRLTKALPRPGTKIAYTYDLGDCWDHEITLEKILDIDNALTYPICLTGRGDAPVEDYNPDAAEDPVPFDKDDINRRLAKLG
jgi:hypothetical protein